MSWASSVGRTMVLVRVTLGRVTRGMWGRVMCVAKDFGCGMEVALVVVWMGGCLGVFVCLCVWCVCAHGAFI